MDKIRTGYFSRLILIMVLLGGLLFKAAPAYAGDIPRLKIKKVDQDGNPVAGAEFEVYGHRHFYIDAWDPEEILEIEEYYFPAGFPEEGPPVAAIYRGWDANDKPLYEFYWDKEEAEKMCRERWNKVRVSAFGSSHTVDKIITDDTGEAMASIDGELFPAIIYTGSGLYRFDDEYKIVETRVPDGYFAEETEHIVSLESLAYIPGTTTQLFTAVNIKLDGPYEPPKIASKASGELTADENQTVTDTVKLSKLIPGVTYTLTGKLMDKENKTEIYTSQPLTFKAENKEEVKEIVFKFDATNLAGKKLVVFQTLNWLDKGKNQTATHADYNDADQTVMVPPSDSEASIKQVVEVPNTLKKAIINIIIGVIGLITATCVYYFKFIRKPKIMKNI